MTNGNDMATGFAYDDTTRVEGGLTKREYFAAMEMQGICANIKAIYGDSVNACAMAAEDAVRQADALINALNENK